jgi:hypothetical protein
MKDRQAGEILIDQGKCATNVREKLENVVFTVAPCILMLSKQFINEVF